MSRPNSSPALVWEVIRSHNNAFVLKRQGRMFSTEPGNLMNKHSPKYSGVSNDLVVDVFQSGRRVKVMTKCNNKARKNCPAKQFVTSRLSAHPAAANRSVQNLCKGYRPQLAYAAAARVSAVNKLARANVAKWGKSKKAKAKAAAKKAAGKK